MATSVLHSPRNPHFFQPLLPGFHSHLSIPLKFFSEHIEGRNEKNTVELQSDACENTWTVKMEGLRLTTGWKEFTVAHAFRIGDILIFRHEGDLVFHVTSFGPSCCELEYEQDNTGNLSTKQYLKTEPESFSSDESCFIARVTDSNLRVDTLFLPRQLVRFDGLNKGTNKIILYNGARTWTLALKFRDSSRSFYMRAGWTSFCHDNGLEPGDSIIFNLESNNTKTPLLRFSSAESKWVPTNHSSKGKKRKTGESSQRMSSSSSSSSSSLSENRFVTLTVTSNNLRKCSFRLPLRFTRVNQMEKAGGKIILLDKNGEEWPVNLLMYRGSMILGSGIKRFLKAIGIKASESFVLELVWEDTATPPLLKFCSHIKT